MRFHELAKELGVESKKLLQKMIDDGVAIKSHMSVITEEQESIARRCAQGLLNGSSGKDSKGEKKELKKPAVKPKKKIEEPIIEEPKEKIFLVKKEKPKPVVVEPPKEVVKKEEPIKIEEPKKQEVLIKKPVEVVVKQTPTPAHTPTFKPHKPEPKSEPILEEEILPKEEVQEEEAPKEPEEKVLKVSFPIKVKDLADLMDVKPNILITKLMGYGVFATITQSLDQDTATIAAHEFGFDLEGGTAAASKAQQEGVEEGTAPELEMVEEIPLPFEAPDDPKDLKERAPVVTILGHVDHGKTSLLDKIRVANVAASETGGITQHIGAYRIMHNNRPITFLDTPGHEAFTAMRARGASVTDIAILVVAADDGIMPQTEEAIDHALAAKVPIIVAINKMDLPGASPDKIKQQLAQRNLATEDWGGQVIAVEVSATKGTGIEKLLEMILLQAEMLELKANPNRLAYGTVVESKLSPGRGPIVTTLIRKGTLKIGDYIVSDLFSGRVKAMSDHQGIPQKEAAPSVPVEVLGLNGVPEPGADFFSCATEKEARLITERRLLKKKIQEKKSKGVVTLEDMFNQISAGQIKSMNIILKTDVQGSLEALKKSLTGIPSDKISLKIIHSGVGDISESDVMLASASKAVAVGFHVRVGAKTKDLAKRERVEIRLYEIIYQLIDDVRKAMQGMLEPTVHEVVIGQAQVRQVFKVSKAGTIAGCYVTDGSITRQSKVRLKRDKEVLFDGQIASLKRFKDEVREVKSGFECGIRLADFDQVQENDFLEAYILEKQETLL